MKTRPALLAFSEYLSAYDFTSPRPPQTPAPIAEQAIAPFFDIVPPGKILHIIQGVNVFFNNESKGFRHVHEVLLYTNPDHKNSIRIAMRYDDEREIKQSHRLIKEVADTPEEIHNLLDNTIGRALGKSRDYHWSAHKGDINPVITLTQIDPNTLEQTRLDPRVFFNTPYVQSHITAEKPLLLLGMAAYMNSPLGIQNAVDMGISDLNAPLALPSGTAIGIAAREGNLDAIDTLLAHPAVHPNGTKGISPIESALMHAIEGNQHAAFDRILASPKTDPNTDGLWLRTLLISAIHMERTNPYTVPGFAEKLITDPRTDINLPDSLYKMPPVIYAIGHPNSKIIEKLVRHPDLDLPLSLDEKYPDSAAALNQYRKLREKPGFIRKLASK